MLVHETEPTQPDKTRQDKTRRHMTEDTRHATQDIICMMSSILCVPHGCLETCFTCVSSRLFLWEKCILPESKTPQLAETQGMFAVALSTWRKRFRSEYR